jgi:hypothetical protein
VNAGLPVLGVLGLAVIGPTAGRWYVDVSSGVAPKHFVRGEWFVGIAALTGLVWVVCYWVGLGVWGSAGIAFIIGYVTLDQSSEPCRPTRSISALDIRAELRSHRGLGRRERTGCSNLLLGLSGDTK